MTFIDCSTWMIFEPFERADCAAQVLLSDRGCIAKPIKLQARIGLHGMQSCEQLQWLLPAACQGVELLQLVLPPGAVERKAR